MTTEKIKIAPERVFAAPDGSELLVRNLRIEVDYNGDQVLAMRMGFDVDAATWKRVDAGGWFNMPVEVRGKTFAGGFESDAIEIEAKLDDDVLTVASLTCEDYWELGALLRGAPLTHDLKKTESWTGLFVKEQRGHFKAGFATKASGMLG